MMARPLVLEDFDRPAPHAAPAAGPSAVPSAAERERERLQSFESGYSAGWEDAARAHEEEQDRISAELGRALQEMSFTFHEAQSALMQQVEPLLAGLVETVLPEAIQPALAETIRVRAAEIARVPGVTVEVVVAPENVQRIEAIARGRPAPPLRVVGEPSLGAGQAFLRFGDGEEKLDLDAALAELRAAVASFASDGEASVTSQAAPPTEEREVRHG